MLVTTDSGEDQRLMDVLANYLPRPSSVNEMEERLNAAVSEIKTNPRHWDQNHPHSSGISDRQVCTHCFGGIMECHAYGLPLTTGFHGIQAKRNEVFPKQDCGIVTTFPVFWLYSGLSKDEAMVLYTLPQVMSQLEEYVATFIANHRKELADAS